MEELLALLRDGHSRSPEMLAAELGTSPEDVRRKMEFLERAGMIRRIKSCSGCPSGCSGKSCAGCLPDGGFQNMGTMWEVL